MQTEDRIIHFSVELIHRPGQVRKEALQKLYFDLSQTRSAYDSTDFTNPMQVKFHSRRGNRTQSMLVFLPDRALIIEEWADIPLSVFLEKVQEIAPRVLECRQMADYVAHAATIRSTFALSHFQDARVFLLERVCAQSGALASHFRRPLAKAGISMSFPETNADPGNYTVLIEPFVHSLNEVYVEVKGVFAKEPTAPDQMDKVVQNVRAVRSFISERVHPFLDSYDLPTEGGLD